MGKLQVLGNNKSTVSKTDNNITAKQDEKNNLVQIKQENGSIFAVIIN